MSHTPDKTYGVGIQVRNIKANTQYTIGFRKGSPSNYASVVISTNDFPSVAYIQEEFANAFLTYPEFTVEIDEETLIIKSSSDFELP